MSNELTTTISASLATYKNKHERALEKFTETHGNLVYDMVEEEERKKARAARREVNSAIKVLDEEHAEIKAPFLEASRKIDATRKEIKDKFLVLSDGIGDQLKYHELEIQKLLDSISDYAGDDTRYVNSDEIDMAISELSALQIDDSFCDKKADAALLKEKTLQTLREKLANFKQTEELERLRKEKEERAAKEERERIEREQREAAAKAEAERKADEAKKAKQEHRAKIHKQAKQSLMSNGIDEKQATKIVELVRDRHIKNVTIIY